MKEACKRCLKESRKVFIEELDKILISLAYQKVDGVLTRVDINHVDVLKRLRIRGIK